MPDPQYLQPLVPIREPVVLRDTGLVTPIWHRYLAGLSLLRALADTHANRLLNYPASDYNAGTVFFETDRGVLYIVDGTPAAWKPVKGSAMEAARADAPTDLGANDAGFRLYVTDFGHLVRWTGTAWEFAPGDVGNGFFRDYAVVPTEVGWQLCDGTVTTYLAVGATLTAVSFTTPPLTTSPAYKKTAAAYSGAINAKAGATGGGTTGGGTTGGGTTGGGTTGGGTTGITTPGATGPNQSAGVSVDKNLDGVTEDVQDNVDHAHGSTAHDHTVPGLSVPGLSVPGLSVPGLSVPALGVGTIEMANIGMLPFFRR